MAVREWGIMEPRSWTGQCTTPRKVIQEDAGPEGGEPQRENLEKRRESSMKAGGPSRRTGGRVGCIT